MNRDELAAYFEEIETEQKYDGYFYSVAEAISIVVLEFLCGLRNVSQIHQWADSEGENALISSIFCHTFWKRLFKNNKIMVA